MDRSLRAVRRHAVSALRLELVVDSVCNSAGVGLAYYAEHAIFTFGSALWGAAPAIASCACATTRALAPLLAPHSRARAQVQLERLHALFRLLCAHHDAGRREEADAVSTLLHATEDECMSAAVQQLGIY